mgnify:CR=1 FL=1
MQVLLEDLLNIAVYHLFLFLFKFRMYRNLLKLKKLSLPSVVREVKGQQFFKIGTLDICLLTPPLTSLNFFKFPNVKVQFLFFETKNAFDELLHNVLFLLRIYNRSDLTVIALVGGFLLGYSSATTIASWTKVVLVVAIVVRATLLIVVALVWLV